VDTLVVPSLLPCTCIAKREVASWPFIGAITVRLGVLFVERECPYSGAVLLRRVRRALEAGRSVVAFPEGTTSDGRDLLPFRRGVFTLAREMGVPVVAAAIRYEDPAVAWIGKAPFVSHYVHRVARRGQTRVRISLSTPFEPRAWPSAAALAAAARQHILGELGRARPATAGLRRSPPDAQGLTTSLPTPSW
jgi:1-acyl-sn-glycerol-3-phosphate acyltransferase